MNLIATALSTETLRTRAPLARHQASAAAPNDVVHHREEEDLPIPRRPPGLGGRRTCAAPAAVTAAPGSANAPPSQVAAITTAGGASPRAAMSEVGASEGYRIVIEDARVRTHLERLPDEAARQDCLTRAAEIGIRAIESASQIDFADEVRQALSHTLEQHSSEMAESNALHREVLKSLAQAAELAEVRKKSLDEQERLLHDLQKARKGASHIVGDSFEERVGSVLASLASSRGDGVERTGTKIERDGKVGDVVYILNIDGGFAKPVRIALEAKNRECAQSGKSRFFLDQLDEAMSNRECQYGIVVAGLEHNQDTEGYPRFPYLQRFPPNRFVVLVDEALKDSAALEAAIQIIATIARAKSSAPVEELAMDEINGALERAATVGQRFRARKENLTKLSQTVAILRQDAERDELEYDTSLTDLRRALHKFEKGSSSPTASKALGVLDESHEPGEMRIALPMATCKVEEGSSSPALSPALGDPEATQGPGESRAAVSTVPMEWEISPRERPLGGRP